MVGRQHGHYTVSGSGTDQRRTQRHGGAGVAPARLADDVAPGQFWELPAHDGGLHGIGDDENVLQRRDRLHTVDRLLKERALAQQSDELFRLALAADRPESFAPAAGHDDDIAILALH